MNARCPSRLSALIRSTCRTKNFCVSDWEKFEMARLIGGVGASHVPSIYIALDRGLRGSPDWKPFFDGCVPCQEWAALEKPDIAIVVFNDHGNAFFDKTPTFAIGCADRYMPIDE